MPKRSSVVLKLPSELLLELDGRIIEHGFGGYAEHAAWLARQGHVVSRSALQRYGRALAGQLPPPLARIRLNSAIRARIRAETGRRGDTAEVAETALDLAEEALQEVLHARLEAGAALDLEELNQLFRMLADAARARGTLSRARDRAGAAAPRRGGGLTPAGEAALRAALEGSGG